MSNRELQVESEISTFRGVDERTVPTLLDSNFFSSSRNVYFGLDGVVSRIEGKLLLRKLDDSIVNLVQFGDKIIIQTLATLQIVTLKELYEPEPPTPPESLFLLSDTDPENKLVSDGDGFNLISDNG